MPASRAHRNAKVTLRGAGGDSTSEERMLTSPSNRSHSLLARLARAPLGVGVTALLGLAACKGEPPQKPAQPPAPPAPAAPAPAPEPPAALAPDTVVAAEPDVAAAPPAPAAPSGWWRGAVFYEVFVRSFADSNGDGIGDLPGLIDKLDYRNDGHPEGGDDLGVDGIWLMPINASPSYHGYDVTDYKAVNPDYGDLATFDKLVAEAHKRGLRVITDFVINHSSSQHPWFVSSQAGPSADKRDWYSWRDTPPEGWKRPWDASPVWHEANGSHYYALFWSGMPDLNLANPAVEAEMHDVARFWLARGMDGFRVDAVRHLFETEDGVLADAEANHPFLRRLRATLDKEFPEALVVAEAWSGAEDQVRYYGQGDEFHMGFSFETADKLKSAVKDGVRSELNQLLDKVTKVFPDRFFEAPFLTNHDMPRVMRQLGGDAQGMRLAAALLLAWQGAPFLYYGEEIGMVGGEGGEDEKKRTPMRWTGEGPGVGFTSGTPWFAVPDEAPGVDVATQAADPKSLLSLYRRLIAARRAHPALRTGSTERLELDAGPGVVAFVRASESERVLVVVNLAREAAPAFEIKDLAGSLGVILAEGLEGEIVKGEATVRVPAMGPRAFAYFSL